MDADKGVGVRSDGGRTIWPKRKICDNAIASIHSSTGMIDDHLTMVGLIVKDGLD